MILAIIFLAGLFSNADADAKWTFAGDILLGREVETELKAKPNANPWQGIHFGSDEIVVGNFEASVGERIDCVHPGELCLTVDPKRLHLLKVAGFKYLGLENNHSHDTGANGQASSQTALKKEGLDALTFAESPYLVREGGIGIGLVTFDFVSSTKPTILEIEKKIRLAKRLSNWTIVYVHWGTELLGWPNASQKALAGKLVGMGADLVVGHHPHVIQEPECVNGRPVYYSLGNHLFDQRYSSTHTGLVVRCRFGLSRFSCEHSETVREPGSSFPKLSAVKLTQISCEKEVKRIKPVATDRWEGVSEGGKKALILLDHSTVRAQTGTFALEGFSTFYRTKEKPSVFIAHLAYSDLDEKVALRPAVYEWKSGALRPVWKGSALAYPIEDMDIVHDVDGDYLCALHSKEAHFLKKKVPDSFRTLAYRWNGFGFSRDLNRARQKRCGELFPTLENTGTE